jgi:hypothetical protein
MRLEPAMVVGSLAAFFGALVKNAKERHDIRLSNPIAFALLSEDAANR